MQIGSKGNVVVAGFVPQDAEMTFVGDKQTPKTKFSIKASGRNVEPVVWVSVVAWGNLALVAQSIQKGDNVMVAGTMSTWESNNGKTYTDLTADYICLAHHVPDSYVPEPRAADSTVPPMPEINEDLPF